MTSLPYRLPSEEVISKLYPERGWLHEYRAFTDNHEAPLAFHLYVGISIIGAALGNRVYLQRGHVPIYPNMYIILISPPGVCRKSSAISIGETLLREAAHRRRVLETEGRRKIIIERVVTSISEKITPEALVHALAQASAGPAGIVCSGELGVFLGKQRYNEGLIDLLTRLMDCPKDWDSSTILRGKTAFKGVVCLSVLGGSTPDWLADILPREAFSGGFMSRVLYVCQENTPRSFPEPIPLDEARSHNLVEYLKRLVDFRGRVTMSEEASKWFDPWYHEHKRSPPENDRMIGYHARKPTHIQRVAMILSLSESLEPKVELKHLISAKELIEAIEPGLEHVILPTSLGAAGYDFNAVRQVLMKHGTIPHTQLLRRLSPRGLNSEAVRRVLQTYIESEMVEVINPKPRTYKWLGNY